MKHKHQSKLLHCTNCDKVIGIIFEQTNNNDDEESSIGPECAFCGVEIACIIKHSTQRSFGTTMKWK